jgi:uncharacterized protein (UPF0332 family)
MKRAPFLLTLVRKSAKALKVARLALESGDNHSAVSRSYYAMFDMARATLLRTGITEDKLPRTHGAVIEAFRNHTRQSERIDQQLATQLSRIESAIAESRIDTNLDPVYLEELRRQARENWLTLQRQRAGSV